MATKDGRRRPRRQIPWSKLFWRTFGVLLLIGAVIFGWLAYTQINNPRQTDFKSDEEFFKYGSIGNNVTDGLPLKIWAVLPKVCSPLIAKGGYKNFGFIYERGKDIPIGFSKVSILGTELVAINCAICHVQTYKRGSDNKSEMFVGGTNTHLDSQAYLRFISNCAATPNFTPKYLLPAIQERFPETTWLERMTYRHFVIPYARREIGRLITKRYAWTWRRPAWGPGRVDPFNPVKFDYLEQPIDETIGNSDIMPAWNARLKENIQEARNPGKPKNWHWDGLSRDLWEVILNSALGDGTTAKYYDRGIIDRLKRYLYTIKSPLAPIIFDPILKAEGEALFATHCADCHSPKGERVMSLIPVEEVGTDPNRLAMWTDGATKAYNNYDKDGRKVDSRGHAMPWTFKHFNNEEKYIAQPLNGIWLTGPYLHNGSVPTLMDLLRPAPERPKAFIRGRKELDFKRGGYASPSCVPENFTGKGFCYDTSLRGNSNQGHEYGTNLTDDERRALVHYLLSL